MDLLPLTVLARMPTGTPADQLSYLANSARVNLGTAIANDRAGNLGSQVDALRGIYMDALAKYAHQLGSIILQVPSTNTERSFLTFDGKLNNAIGHLRVQELLASSAEKTLLLDSSLSRTTKRVLRVEITNLINLIEESDLDDKKRRALIKKACELQWELDQDGANIAKLLAITAAIASILGGGSTSIINAPKIIASIQNMNTSLGDEVLDIEERRPALPGPPKLLPAPDIEDDRQGGSEMQII